MEITKTCTGCKETKELVNFYKNNLGKFGYSCRCKECQKIYRNLNVDKFKESAKLYRELNKHKWKEYHEKNKEKNLKRLHEYQIINKEKIKAREKVYRKNNKDTIKKRLKDYNSVNKEKLRISRSIYFIENKNNLTDVYIRGLIQSKNKNLKNIPQEIIELKRIQIKTLRLCQQLQN